MKRYYISFAIIILLNLNVMALIQDSSKEDLSGGYVLLLNGEKAYGDISLQLVQREVVACKLKTDKGKVTYYPNDIIHFVLNNGRKYTSEIIPGHFVEVVIQGRLSLYKKANDFIVQKDEGEIILLEKQHHKTSNRWKGVLAMLTSDCPQIKNDLEKLEFTPTKISNVVRNYNAFMDYEYTEPRNSVPAIIVSPGIKFGYSYSNISTNVLNVTIFPNIVPNYSSENPFAGVQFELFFPRVSDKFSILTEINWLRNTYSDYRVETDTYLEVVNVTRTTEANISLTTFGFPVLVKYVLINGPIDLYLLGGLNFTLNKGSAHYSSILEMNDKVTHWEDQLMPINPFEYGLMGGIEAGSSIGRMRIGVRFTLQSDILNNNIGIASYNRRASVSLVVSYK
jgi:hypothetical protein